MRTVTCDICGATTRSNTKWATTVIEDYHLHSLTMEPLVIESRTIDLCADCTADLLGLLKDRVKKCGEVAP
jgi:hypothetical protein